MQPSSQAGALQTAPADGAPKSSPGHFAAELPVSWKLGAMVGSHAPTSGQSSKAMHFSSASSHLMPSMIYGYRQSPRSMMGREGCNAAREAGTSARSGGGACSARTFCVLPTLFGVFASELRYSYPFRLRYLKSACTMSYIGALLGQRHPSMHTIGHIISCVSHVNCRECAIE